MLYVNPCYPDLFDVHGSRWVYSAANDRNGNTKPYMERNSATDDVNDYCGKNFPGVTDCWHKVSLYNGASNYHADVTVVVTDGTTVTLFDVLDSYTNDGMYGHNDCRIPYNKWFDYIFHYTLQTHSDGKVHLHADGIAGTHAYTGRYFLAELSSEAKITGIRIRASFNIRDLIIADFKLYKNDEIKELPITAHGGNFVSSANNTYDLETVGAVGTVTLDTSSITTADYQLLGGAYKCTASRNNEDINALSINYGGVTSDYTLADGSQILTAGSTNVTKDSLSTVTVTAKKV